MVSELEGVLQVLRSCVKEEVAVLGSPSLIVLMVSELERVLPDRVLPELRRGGRPGFPVPNSPYGQ